VIKGKDDLSQSFAPPRAEGSGWKMLEKLKLFYI
jgi:hypothetical protein